MFSCLHADPGKADWVNLFRVEVLQSEYNTKGLEKDKGVKCPCKGNDFNSEQKT